MEPVTTQGLFGLSTDWLKFGVLGLLAICIIVTASVALGGARNPKAYRLALFFMGFILIVAALAIVSEIYKDNTALKNAVAERDTAREEMDEAKAARDAAVAAEDAAMAKAAALTSKIDAMVANVNGEIGNIVNALDAKWCVSVKEMPESPVKSGAILFITQMRNSVASIREDLGVTAQHEAVPIDCATLVHP